MAFQSRTQRTFLTMFIVCICSCALGGVVILLTDLRGMFIERTLVTLAAIGGSSLLALGAAIPTELRRWHPLGPCALGVICVTLAVSLVSIWVSYQYWPDDLEKFMGTGWLWSVELTVTGLLSLARLHARWNCIRTTTVVLLAIAGLQITATLWMDIHQGDDWFRLMSILLILGLCGVLVTPVLHHLSRTRLREDVRTTNLTLSLTCPRCQKTQEMAVGRSKCAGCGLKFDIDIEEETCRKCGYSLFQIQSAVCPECGTPIFSPPRSAEAGSPAPLPPGASG